MENEKSGTGSLSRRSLLAAGAAGALAATLPNLSTVVRAASRRSPQTPLKTIIVACQENRSFDHYFGVYPKVGQYGIPAGYTNPDGQGGTVAPYHLSSVWAGSLNEPDHEWAFIHNEWDNGKMDGFYTTNGQVAMGYYDSSNLGYYYALAQYFTLCTNYFCALLGPTNPNRIYMVAGTSGGNTSNSVPQGSLTFPSIFDLLDEFGITWKVYNGFLAKLSGFNQASYFSKYNNDPRANVDDDVYFTDCANGTLPQVAFIAPNALFCEHPPFPCTWGQWYIAERINALIASPQWLNSAFILTYDEAGGFFDHVTPPVVDAYGSGIRIPTTVVSPYTFNLGGTLAPAIYDHSSILKLIETVFGLPTLASVNTQFNTQTPGTNNDAANGGTYGPPAPPRDGSSMIGNLIDVFNFGAHALDAAQIARLLPHVPAPRGVPSDPAQLRRIAQAINHG